MRAANIRDLGDIPLVLLLAGKSEDAGGMPDLALSGSDLDAAEERERQRTARLVGLSPQGRAEIVADSGHRIQVDRLDSVIAAISEVLAAAR